MYVPLILFKSRHKSQMSSSCSQLMPADLKKQLVYLQKQLYSHN